MTVVLHACCGPCASACVPRLKAEGHDVTLLFANSNIDTAEEFERRRAAAEALAHADGVPFAVLPYDHGEWLREVAAGYEDAPEKGARCARCYRYNLRKAAEFAAAHGLEAFTTSLTVSPHKPSAVVFAAGEAVAAVAGRPPCQRPAVSGRAVAPRPPQFLADDFKKKEGFKVSVRRAAELGLYRQDYCGCEFSRRPAAPFPMLFARTNTRSFLAALKRLGLDAAQIAICHCHASAWNRWSQELAKAADIDAMVVAFVRSVSKLSCARSASHPSTLNALWYNMRHEK